MRDAGEIGGDHPADGQPVIVFGQVDQLPQPVQGAASLRFCQRVGELGAAEDDRRAGLDGPAAAGDDDALPGPGAHVDHDGAVVTGGPQPHRHRFEVGGLPYQHGDGIGQVRAGGDLAGLPVQGGGQPGPQAVLRFRRERHGDLRAQPGHGVGAAVVSADQPVGVFGHAHQDLRLARALALPGRRFLCGDGDAVRERLLTVITHIRTLLGDGRGRSRTAGHDTGRAGDA